MTRGSRDCAESAVAGCLLLLAFAPTAVSPEGSVDADMRMLEEDVRKQLSSGLSKSLTIGARAYKEGSLTFGRLKQPRLETFALHDVIAFEHLAGDDKAKPKGTVWTKVSLKFSAKLRADFSKYDSNVFTHDFGVYSVERTKQPFAATGIVKRNVKTSENDLTYEKEGSSLKSGIREGFAIKTSISDKDGKKLSSYGADGSTYHTLEQYFELAISEALENAIARAFSTSLQDRQWKQGPSDPIVLEADSISQIINRFLINQVDGTAAFGFRLQGPFYDKADYPCKLNGTPVKIGSIVLKDVAKQGRALLVAFEIRKAMLSCVADGNRKTREFEIPSLSTMVRLEQNGSLGTNTNVVRCSSVEHERFDASATSQAKIPVDVLNDLDRKLAKETCLLVREIALMTMSNFVGLRMATFVRD